MDLHDVDRRLNRFLGSLEEKCGSKENAKHIRRFIDYCFSIGLSKMRVLKYVSTLVKISRVIGKPLRINSTPTLKNPNQNLKVNFSQVMRAGPKPP
ncbi:MAG TPA: hypothetical protein ENH03_02155 [Candidatus Bathyarchaeota archaeon]|nr:hypothetical protein [Candidatus Bathyarchaeota archaeon]